MASISAKFQSLSVRLFDRFSDLVRPAVFTKPGASGTFDPVTGTITGGSSARSSNAGAIRANYEANEVDGQKIQVNDFKLLVRVNDLSIDPRTDSVKVSFDGLTCNIIRATKDAADVIWTLQVRQV